MDQDTKNVLAFIVTIVFVLAFFLISTTLVVSRTSTINERACITAGGVPIVGRLEGGSVLMIECKKI